MKGSAIGSTFKRTTASLTAAALLFTTAGNGWADSSLWSDRRRARQTLSEPANAMAAASTSFLSGLPDARVTRGAGDLLQSSSAVDPQLKALQGTSFLKYVPVSHTVVREVHLPAGAKTFVLHIQDVHGNAEAQRNLAEALKGAQTAHQKDFPGGKLLAGLEGAAGPFLTDYYRSFPDQDALARVSQAFFEKDLLTGAELGALTASSAPELWGVEDRALYDRHVRSVRDAFPREGALKDALAEAARRLAPLKEKTFGAALKEWDALYGSYQDGKLPLGDYVKGLHRDAPVGRYRNLDRFIQALAREGELDFARAESDRKALIEALAAKLPRAELQALADRALAFRAGRIGYADFNDALKTLTARAGFSFSRFAAFDDYVRYVDLVESIDRRALLEEMDRLADRKTEALLKGASPEARSAHALSRDLIALRKLSSHALTPPDWEACRLRREDLRRLPGRLDALEGRSPSEDASFAAALRPLEEFYDAALARNEALIGNLLSKMESSSSRVAVLVAGGFHTDGMTALLRKEGVAYAVVAPRFEKAGDANYLEVFRDDKTPVERLFSSEKVTLLAPLGLAEAPLDGAARAKRWTRLSFLAALATRQEGLPFDAVAKFLSDHPDLKHRPGSLLEGEEGGRKGWTLDLEDGRRLFFSREPVPGVRESFSVGETVRVFEVKKSLLSRAAAAVKAVLTDPSAGVRVLRLSVAGLFFAFGVAVVALTGPAVLAGTAAVSVLLLPALLIASAILLAVWERPLEALFPPSGPKTLAQRLLPAAGAATLILTGVELLKAALPLFEVSGAAGGVLSAAAMIPMTGIVLDATQPDLRVPGAVPASPMADTIPGSGASSSRGRALFNDVSRRAAPSAAGSEGFVRLKSVHLETLVLELDGTLFRFFPTGKEYEVSRVATIDAPEFVESRRRALEEAVKRREEALMKSSPAMSRRELEAALASFEKEEARRLYTPEDLAAMGKVWSDHQIAEDGEIDAVMAALERGLVVDVPGTDREYVFRPSEKGMRFAPFSGKAPAEGDFFTVSPGVEVEPLQARDAGILRRMLEHTAAELGQDFMGIDGQALRQERERLAAPRSPSLALSRRRPPAPPAPIQTAAEAGISEDDLVEETAEQTVQRQVPPEAAAFLGHRLFEGRGGSLVGHMRGVYATFTAADFPGLTFNEYSPRKGEGPSQFRVYKDGAVVLQFSVARDLSLTGPDGKPLTDKELWDKLRKERIGVDIEEGDRSDERDEGKTKVIRLPGGAIPSFERRNRTVKLTPLETLFGSVEYLTPQEDFPFSFQSDLFPSLVFSVAGPTPGKASQRITAYRRGASGSAARFELDVETGVVAMRLGEKEWELMSPDTLMERLERLQWDQPQPAPQVRVAEPTLVDAPAVSLDAMEDLTADAELETDVAPAKDPTQVLDFFSKFPQVQFLSGDAFEFHVPVSAAEGVEKGYRIRRVRAGGQSHLAVTELVREPGETEWQDVGEVDDVEPAMRALRDVKPYVMTLTGERRGDKALIDLVPGQEVGGIRMENASERLNDREVSAVGQGILLLKDILATPTLAELEEAAAAPAEEASAESAEALSIDAPPSLDLSGASPELLDRALAAVRPERGSYAAWTQALSADPQARELLADLTLQAVRLLSKMGLSPAPSLPAYNRLLGGIIASSTDEVRGTSANPVVPDAILPPRRQAPAAPSRGEVIDVIPQEAVRPAPQAPVRPAAAAWSMNAAQTTFHSPFPQENIHSVSVVEDPAGKEVRLSYFVTAHPEKEAFLVPEPVYLLVQETRTQDKTTFRVRRMYPLMPHDDPGRITEAQEFSVGPEVHAMLNEADRREFYVSLLLDYPEGARMEVADFVRTSEALAEARDFISRLPSEAREAPATPAPSAATAGVAVKDVPAAPAVPPVPGPFEAYLESLGQASLDAAAREAEAHAQARRAEAEEAVAVAVSGRSVPVSADAPQDSIVEEDIDLDWGEDADNIIVDPSLLEEPRALARAPREFVTAEPLSAEESARDRAARAAEFFIQAARDALGASWTFSGRSRDGKIEFRRDDRRLRAAGAETPAGLRLLVYLADAEGEKVLGDIVLDKEGKLARTSLDRSLLASGMTDEELKDRNRGDDGVERTRPAGRSRGFRWSPFRPSRPHGPEHRTAPRRPAAKRMATWASTIAAFLMVVLGSRFLGEDPGRSAFRPAGPASVVEVASPSSVAVDLAREVLSPRAEPPSIVIPDAPAAADAPAVRMVKTTVRVKAGEDRRELSQLPAEERARLVELQKAFNHFQDADREGSAAYVMKAGKGGPVIVDARTGRRVGSVQDAPLSTIFSLGGGNRFVVQKGQAVFAYVPRYESRTVERPAPTAVPAPAPEAIAAAPAPAAPAVRTVKANVRVKAGEDRRAFAQLSTGERAHLVELQKALNHFLDADREGSASYRIMEGKVGPVIVDARTGRRVGGVQDARLSTVFSLASGERFVIEKGKEAYAYIPRYETRTVEKTVPVAPPAAPAPTAVAAASPTGAAPVIDRVKPSRQDLIDLIGIEDAVYVKQVTPLKGGVQQVFERREDGGKAVLGRIIPRPNGRPVVVLKDNRRFEKLGDKQYVKLVVRRQSSVQGSPEAVPAAAAAPATEAVAAAKAPRRDAAGKPALSAYDRARAVAKRLLGQPAQVKVIEEDAEAAEDVAKNEDDEEKDMLRTNRDGSRVVLSRSKDKSRREYNVHEYDKKQPGWKGDRLGRLIYVNGTNYMQVGKYMFQQARDERGRTIVVEGKPPQSMARSPRSGGTGSAVSGFIAERRVAWGAESGVLAGLAGAAFAVARAVLPSELEPLSALALLLYPVAFYFIHPSSRRSVEVRRLTSAKIFTAFAAASVGVAAAASSPLLAPLAVLAAGGLVISAWHFLINRAATQLEAAMRRAAASRAGLAQAEEDLAFFNFQARDLDRAAMARQIYGAVSDRAARPLMRLFDENAPELTPRTLVELDAEGDAASAFSALAAALRLARDEDVLRTSSPRSIHRGAAFALRQLITAAGRAPADKRAQAAAAVSAGVQAVKLLFDRVAAVTGVREDLANVPEAVRLAELLGRWQAAEAAIVRDPSLIVIHVNRAALADAKRREGVVAHVRRWTALAAANPSALVRFVSEDMSEDEVRSFLAQEGALFTGFLPLGALSAAQRTWADVDVLARVNAQRQGLPPILAVAVATPDDANWTGNVIPMAVAVLKDVADQLKSLALLLSQA